MRVLAPQPGPVRQQTTGVSSTASAPDLPRERSREAITILNLQRTIGNRAVQCQLKQAGRVIAMSRDGLLPGLQTQKAKSSVAEPSRRPAGEANHVSKQVAPTEAPGTGVAKSPSLPISYPVADHRANGGTEKVQRQCSECEQETERNRAESSTDLRGDEEATTAHDSEAELNAVQGGEPLSREQRSVFEPLFGADFSRVRIHANDSADAAARSIGAIAYTRGSDVVFRADQYQPTTSHGRELLAHELTHVVQQGAAPALDPQRYLRTDTLPTHASQVHLARQALPGTGMTPPGDCSWSTYLPLRGAVEAAKALVSSLGACAPETVVLFWPRRLRPLRRR